MFWKLLIKFLKNKDITKTVKCGNQIFIVKVYKWKDTNRELQEWKNALNK